MTLNNSNGFRIFNWWHHNTTQGRVKHCQLRGSYLSHDVERYQNLFHP